MCRSYAYAIKEEDSDFLAFQLPVQQRKQTATDLAAADGGSAATASTAKEAACSHALLQAPSPAAAAAATAKEARLARSCSDSVTSRS
jgi:hypothetical protein